MIRRKTRQIKLGNVKIGASAPVSVQSMAKTGTADIARVVKEIRELERAGCEIIRVAVKDADSARAIKKIVSKIKIPLEADIHFDHRLALLSIKSGADGIRLNPGNVGDPEHVREVIRAAKAKKIPIRIGVNSGSVSGARGLRMRRHVEAGAMVKACVDYLKIFEKDKFRDIMISLKASDVMTTIEAYRAMAKECDYPFHLGVTATGAGDEGLIKSAIGIGALLAEGIGDTIRVSLTGSAYDEVIAGREILQSIGLRKFYPEIISCPTCGRCQVDLVRIVNDFRKKLHAARYTLPAERSFSVALMGCEVNGPGEAKEADIGIAFGKDFGMIFKKGKTVKKVRTKDAVKELFDLLKKW